MSENEKIALLRLHRIPGIGPVGALKLVGYFGSVEGVFSASRRSLLSIPGMGPTTVRNLLETSHRRAAEEEWEQLKGSGIKCTSWWDIDYPPLLKQCEDAPVLLFHKGNISLTGKRFISIVGTRKMTDYGRRSCEELVRDLTPYQPVIVSGLAYGIDVCAQRAALRNGLQTIACMAHGLDRIYPEGHRRVFMDIMDQGGVLSEFSLGTPPERMHFVRRNRIIAGLSEATVVIESASEGGSLITADLAFGYHREVFALPGRIADPYSEGCNTLIRDHKAHLLQSAADLARVLNWSEEQEGGVPIRKPRINFEGMGEKERSIADFLLRKEVASLDDIAVGCAFTVKETASLLFTMEMSGIIRSLPGKTFEIAGR